MPTPKAPVPPPDAAPLRPRRRQAAITLLAAPWAWTGASAQPAQRLRATPRQTEGPFYPVALPADTDHDLLKNGALRYSGGTLANRLNFTPTACVRPFRSTAHRVALRQG